MSFYRYPLLKDMNIIWKGKIIKNPGQFQVFFQNLINSLEEEQQFIDGCVKFYR